MKRKPISRSARIESSQSKEVPLKVSPVTGASPKDKIITPVSKKDSKQQEFGSYSETELQIKSRERTLDLLKDKMKDFDAEALKQLEARDRRILDINKQNLELQASLKNKSAENKDIREKNQHILALEEEIESLNNQLMNAKTSRDNLKKEFETARRAWEEEKEGLEMIQEGLMEEQEGFKTQVAKKSEEVSEVKRDIIELSKIINMMTNLNKDLNEKVENMNHEMETLNTNYFEAIAKVQHIDEIEASLKEYANSAQINGAYAIRYQKRVERLENERNELGSASRSSIQNLQTVLSSLQQTNQLIQSLQPNTFDQVKQTTTNQLTELFKDLTDVKREIAKHTPPERVISEPNDLNSFNPSEDEQAPAELLKKIKAMERKEVSLVNHLKSLEKYINSHSQERESNFQNLKKRLDIEIQTSAQLREKIENLRKDSETKEVALTKLQTKVINLTERIEHYLTKSKAEENRFNSYEAEIKDLKDKLISYKRERMAFDKEIKQRERRMAKILKQVAIFQDEIWRRDTEFVRKAKEVKTVEDRALELDETNKKLHSEIKERVTREIEQFNKVMEDKDREINLLKEMLRGAQIHAKTKEGESSRIRNRPEVPSPEPKTPSKPTKLLTSSKKSTDGMNNTSLKQTQFIDIASKSENALSHAKELVTNILSVMTISSPTKRTPNGPQDIAANLCTELSVVLTSIDQDISMLKHSL